MPKDKINKLEATGRKGTFVGYCENSKAFRIYIPGQRKVEISRDVTFDEDVALGKARDLPPPPPPEKNDDMDILDDPSIPEFETDIVDDPMEPMDPLDPHPCDPPARKRPPCLRDTLQDDERRAPIRRSFRERKKPCKYQGYVAAMITMIQVEPPTFEEVVKEQVWKDAMAEEYESIMKNDVWDVVSRLKGESVVTSKWLFKIKHGVDGSIEKYKARFVGRGFSQKDGEDYDDIFSPVAR